MAISVVLAPIAHAQTPANADAVYNGFLGAYLYDSGGTTYLTNSLTDRGEAFQWQQAYLITGVEDAYDRNMSQDRQAFISKLLDRFIVKNFKSKNSTDLAWDTWNDDSAWATIALARGYQITGNPLYLADAKAVWDMAYDRGWDSKFGGGIWENQEFKAKCALSNVSFVPAAIILYQATGDAAYLTKAQALYAWTRANLMDSTGEVNECIQTSGESRDSNVYNSGLMLNAAAILYRITGTEQYHDDAALVSGYQTKRWPVMTPDYPNNGPFGCDQFFRGLSNFARWNGLWSQYYPWLKTTASAAWNTRRTDHDISHNDYAAQTPGTGDLLSMESLSSMSLQQVIAIDDIANPPSFSGAYEIQNANSHLAVAVSGASSAGGAAIVQEAFAGGNEAMWTITATSGGYYQLTNVNSGQALEVKDASGVGGADVVQLPAHGMRPGDDQWMPVLDTNGTYTFFNLNSQQVLEVPGASAASGTQLTQAFANATSAQKFQLVPHQPAPASDAGAKGSGGATPAGASGAGAGGGASGTGAGGGAGGGGAGAATGAPPPGASGSGGGGAVPPPSTLPGSQGFLDASAAASSGGTASPGSSSGCGCRASAGPPSSGVLGGLGSLLALGAAGAVRRRRSRAPTISERPS